MNGRFNVSYSDVATLAFPVLRHRMKMNFEAIAERVAPDTVIRMIVEEVARKNKVHFDASVWDAATGDSSKNG